MCVLSFVILKELGSSPWNSYIKNGEGENTRLTFVLLYQANYSSLKQSEISKCQLKTMKSLQQIHYNQEE